MPWWWTSLTVASARHVGPATLPSVMAKRPTPRNLFSFSRLKAFDQCPARYRYRYLKGLKEAFQSVEAHLGTVVHDVLEWLYREREGAADPTPAASARSCNSPPTRRQATRRRRARWTRPAPSR